MFDGLKNLAGMASIHEGSAEDAGEAGGGEERTELAEIRVEAETGGGCGLRDCERPT